MDSKKIKISVIIPAYNSQEYIRASLESAICQCANSEIIVINDGSIDHTSAVVKKMQNEYDNIVLIEQNHLGPSAARNKGIQLARGEFVVFLDSDDTLVLHSLNRLYKKAIKTKTDIVVGQMNFISSGKKVNLDLRTPLNVKGFVMRGQDYFESLLKYNIYMATGTNYFYRNDWLKEKKIFFKEGILYEDELWTSQALIKCERLYSSSINYYNYYKRNNSIINSDITPLKIKSLHVVCDDLMNECGLCKKDQDISLNSWVVVNLARVCSIALSRIEDKNEKNFFYDILRMIDSVKELMIGDSESCLNRYMPKSKKK